MSNQALRDEIALPFDNHAESVVCNYVQIHPDRLVGLGLVPQDFHNHRHKRLWSVMLDVTLQHQPVDPGEFYLRLVSSINDRSVLESVDPYADWISDRWDPDAIERDIDHFVERIKRCVVARRIIDAAQQMAERAYRVPNIDFDVTDASAVLSSVAEVPIKEELGMSLPI